MCQDVFQLTTQIATINNITRTGIWDCMDSNEVAEFVRQQIVRETSLKIICEKLMDRCLAPDSEIGGVGCDNMIVIIVALLHGRSLKEWYAEMKLRHPDMQDSGVSTAGLVNGMHVAGGMATAPLTDVAQETSAVE